MANCARRGRKKEIPDKQGREATHRGKRASHRGGRATLGVSSERKSPAASFTPDRELLTWKSLAWKDWGGGSGTG
ncbi:hypothetical protein Acr_05g0004280 [Actinidia rufa]|uniref:Uncharacterized protein n=1 Tax=Actinidia rufa TaxID=165716 RepID=A0A7J0D6R8_9ERIC|nr:hypothetical protein Acr_00g0000150 [Actinidia rufa]GFS28413.1 hypothetical protein Acr_00g0001680 [Actinidia rufa]GFS28500.1 hypothetical protein Acr_00g0002170 [Actinidia rufa]GFY86788.1 hypothetical protein Acr_05g0004270 [Actinidia rufa]GFY86789.1 hypothetical protein Acr_05g0004280 [Actinidia rufa]